MLILICSEQTVPFADFGADVVRVDRIGGALNYDVTARGKRSIAVDLKKPEGAKIIRELSTKFDVLLEPFRTGTIGLKLDDSSNFLVSEPIGIGQGAVA